MFGFHEIAHINPKPNPCRPAASRASAQLERPCIPIVHHHRLSHASPTSTFTTDTDQPVEALAMNRLKQAAGHTKDVATLPPRLLEMYSDFITKNAGAVGQVEGALRSLTYLIPG